MNTVYYSVISAFLRSKINIDLNKNILNPLTDPKYHLIITLMTWVLIVKFIIIVLTNKNLKRTKIKWNYLKVTLKLGIKKSAHTSVLTGV